MKTTDMAKGQLENRLKQAEAKTARYYADYEKQVDVAVNLANLARKRLEALERIGELCNNPDDAAAALDSIATIVLETTISPEQFQAMIARGEIG